METLTAQTGFYIKQAVIADLSGICDIIADATAFLRSQGLPQWQNGYGPNRPDIERDIQKREGYVLADADGREPAGYAALITGIDEVYTNIKGEWDGRYPPYISIHRAALSAGARGRGLAAAFLRGLADTAAGNGFRDIRIDTHPRNIIMIRAILRAGFVYRGVVTFPFPDGERTAYQLLI